MILKTARLRLEPLKMQHASAMFAGLCDESLYQYISERPPANVESLRARYRYLESRRSPDALEEWLNWAVWSLTECCYIGYVQATVTPAHQTVTVAYLFFRRYWGKGYAAEAADAMIRLLKEKYQRFQIAAFTEKANARSIALLRRLGFIEAEQPEKESELRFILPSAIY